jgi:hypothetical protein
MGTMFDVAGWSSAEEDGNAAPKPAEEDDVMNERRTAAVAVRNIDTFQSRHS